LTYTQQTLSRKREFPPCFSFTFFFPYRPTAGVPYYLQADFGSDFHAFFSLPPFPFTNGQDELEGEVVFIKCMNIFNHIPSLLPEQVGKWVLFLKTVGCAERLIDWLAACPPILLCRPDEKKQNEKGSIKK